MCNSYKNPMKISPPYTATSSRATLSWHNNSNECTKKHSVTTTSNQVHLYLYITQASRPTLGTRWSHTTSAPWLLYTKHQIDPITSQSSIAQSPSLDLQPFIWFHTTHTPSPQSWSHDLSNMKTLHKSTWTKIRPKKTQENKERNWRQAGHWEVDKEAVKERTWMEKKEAVKLERLIDKEDPDQGWSEFWPPAGVRKTLTLHSTTTPMTHPPPSQNTHLWTHPDSGSCLTKLQGALTKPWGPHYLVLRFTSSTCICI